MTWVKICGITNLEDAVTAVEAGADAVGFVFHEKSPRKVAIDIVREIVQELPEHVEKIGVFVGEKPSNVLTIAERARLNGVQTYARTEVVDSSVQLFQKGCFKRVICALSVHDHGNGLVVSERRGAGFAVLLDSGNGTTPGGTGKTFDWKAASELAKSISEIAPVIIAGGLTAANVGESIEQFHPFGVDVSSGVEARPGRKDPDKVRAFVQAVRRTDKRA